MMLFLRILYTAISKSSLFTSFLSIRCECFNFGAFLSSIKRLDVAHHRSIGSQLGHFSGGSAV